MVKLDLRGRTQEQGKDSRRGSWNDRRCGTQGGEGGLTLRKNSCVKKFVKMMMEEEWEERDRTKHRGRDTQKRFFFVHTWRSSSHDVKCVCVRNERQGNIRTIITSAENKRQTLEKERRKGRGTENEQKYAGFVWEKIIPVRMLPFLFCSILMIILCTRGLRVHKGEEFCRLGVGEKGGLI